MMKSDILNSKKLGYKIYFRDGDNQIACFGSYFTGKEEVYVNDELVSSKRSLGISSSHKFEFEGSTYQVVFNVQNILIGTLVCSLSKNSKLIEEQKHYPYPLVSSPKNAVLFIGGCFLFGALSGYGIFTIVAAIAKLGG
ncbi:hypothetical protein [Paraglaciecola sp. 2405UD69-4]|uniref:hypothetical protein n=1 Tax=Paraglaciecola sp. 2405UD69-4 TaxID=3391836 RepID=UPI0039C9C23D